MITTKHTSGPWGIMNDGPNGDMMPWKASNEAAPGLTIGSLHNTEYIARVNGYCLPIEANALLIIAAPDLLTALQRLLDTCGDACLTAGHLHTPESCSMCNARETIARATE